MRARGTVDGQGILDRLAPLFVVLSLILIQVAAYAPVWNFELLYFDDQVNVYYNPMIGTLDWHHISQWFLQSSGSTRFQPLGWGSFGVVFALGGLDASWFHAATALFHLLNSLILFCLLRLFLGGEGNASSWTRDLLAGAAAACWALHPLRMETVGWASGLLYSLSIFWGLCSALCFVKAQLRQTHNGDLGRSRLHWVSLLCFLLSMLTYPVCLGLPIALLCFLLWRSHKDGFQSFSPRQLLRRSEVLVVLGMFALGVLVMVVTALFQYEAVQNAGPQVLPGLVDRVARALVMLETCLRRIVLPSEYALVDDRFYGFSLADRGVWFSCAAVLLVLGLSAWRIRRAPALFLLFVAVLAVMFPHLGWLEKMTFPSDRYTYLSSAVLMGGVILTLRRLLPVLQQIATLVMLSVLVFVLMPLSAHQLQHWQNNTTVFGQFLPQLRHEKIQKHFQEYYAKAKDLARPSRDLGPWSDQRQSGRQYLLAHRALERDNYVEAWHRLREARRVDARQATYLLEYIRLSVFLGDLSEAMNAVCTSPWPRSLWPVREQWIAQIATIAAERSGLEVKQGAKEPLGAHMGADTLQDQTQSNSPK